MKEAVKKLLSSRIVKDYFLPLVDAVVQDAIHGTTPTKLREEIGKIIKRDIWSLVKAGPLKIISYLHKSMLTHNYIF